MADVKACKKSDPESFRQDFNFDLPEISKILKSEDGTVKFQMQFKEVASFYIPVDRT